jgi:hypothetical protein
MYGVASDVFIFVRTTHDGTVKLGKTFDVAKGSFESPGMLEVHVGDDGGGDAGKEWGDEKDLGDLADYEFDLVDNEYTNPPQDEEDEDAL